jgi:hypothetical protein
LTRAGEPSCRFRFWAMLAALVGFRAAVGWFLLPMGGTTEVFLSHRRSLYCSPCLRHRGVFSWWRWLDG